MNYVPTIGLEIHAELKTATKMFCSSKNDAHETKANVNICPVCLAHPGTLPVINKQAVTHVLRVGVALGGKLADYTEFDRKNYFYPDLPKGYQISQYEFPLVSGGNLAGVEITRVHLEEDTASSIHNEETGATLVDYNRSGVPLMELVTEPVITSSKQAGDFARELQLLLRYLGASDANMEKGEMRVEANISIRPENTKEFGTKVEIKNLNSFRAMERAVEYEIERQRMLLENGEKVVQETRGWDETKQSTFTQRIKEVAADYRYFPDPDLPSLRLSKYPGFSVAELKGEMHELPGERLKRYIDLGVKNEDATQYVRERYFGDFFDAVLKEVDSDIKLINTASNYICNDIANIYRDIDNRDTDLQPIIPISPVNFAKLIKLIGDGKVSSRAAKDILLSMWTDNRDPEVIATEGGLFQQSSEGDLLPVVQQIIKENEKVVSDYKNGKEAALKALVGKGMKITKGAGNPEMIAKMLAQEIGKM